ncbi:MAG: hypothetical protein R3D84_05750 [Paracoccaceae bacterium]
MTFRFSALASMLLAAAPALAEPATDAGAESLAESFRRYLGPVEGVVTVTPETDHYAVVLDLAPFIAMIPEAQAPGVDVSLSPLAFAMRDEGGGLWAVESGSPPTLQVTVPGKLTLALSAESLTYAGTYDEALSAFSQSQAEIGGLVLNETITDPTQGEMTVSYRIDTLRTESNAKAGLGGGVDLESRIDATGLAETCRSRPTPTCRSRWNSRSAPKPIRSRKAARRCVRPSF